MLKALQLKKRDIDVFLEVWREYDPYASHWMSTKDFPAFLRKLATPVGFKNTKISYSDLKKLIFGYNIRDHEG